jgi:NAD(P)-dependent dehydrogenase (short-subunit alcohol dehydrogenase family)
MRMTGSVALITGGGSGLGEATAHRLAGEGAVVVVADLAASNGQAVADALGGSCVFAPTDVTDPGDVEAAVTRATELGELRMLVNCAGIATPGRVLGREGPLPLEGFARVVTVNLVGTFNTVRLAAARMEQNRELDGDRGVIVNTASVAAFDGQIGQAAYAASKGGVAAMTLPLARDLASRHIRVMAIAPGIFATPMMAGLTPEAQESLESQVPHPARLGRPEEYAALVDHIVANPMLNGEVIRLDGALRMAPR